MTHPLSAVFSVSHLAVACLLFAAANADAAITVTGDVNPNPPMQGDFVTVGFGGTGTLDIEGGDSLSIGNLNVGSQGAGFASVSGTGSSLSVENSVFVGGRFGRFDVLEGALVTIGDRLDLSIGGGPSEAIVDGVRTVVDVNGTLTVGIEGASTLDITNGGRVFVRDFGLGRRGEVRVSGQGSRLATPPFSPGLTRLDGNLWVGDRGRAELGAVDLREGSRLSLDDGVAEFDSLISRGVIAGGGELTVLSSQLPNSGRIETGVGETLSIDFNPFVPEPQGVLFNNGEISISGGTVELEGRLLNDTEGRIALHDGRLRAAASEGFSAIENLRRLAAVGGVNNVHGRVLNFDEGSIAVTNNGVLVFHDHVTGSGFSEISVMPGSRAVFLDGLDVNSTSVLQANIAGTDNNTGFGVAEVVGEANISGQVSVALTGGFAPSLGDRFDLLTASGGVTGEPTLGEAADPGAGLRWELETSETFLALVAVPELDGDFNLDGSVDAADYTTWRDGFGTTFDASDYDVWVGNFGATSPATALAVPEPHAAGLLGLALVGVATGRRR